MHSRTGRVWGGLGLWCAALVGCSLDATGVGTPPAATLGGADEDGGSTAATAGADAPGTDDGTHDVTDGGGTSDSTGDAVDESSTAEPPATGDGEPLLVLSDGPTFDFGAIDVGNQAAHVFTLTNEGDSPAVGLSGMSLADPFSFTGEFPGEFPGAGGTCQSSLPAGDDCTIEVRFVPGEFGYYEGTLSIVSDGPGASRDLVGGGAGRSPNLIENPGGESSGNPPPQWSSVGAGGWMAGAWLGDYPDPPGGNNYLTATQGPHNQDFILRQDVPVDAWTALSDLGLLRLSFQGEARSLANDNDSHRIRVGYRDAMGTELETWDTNWQGTGTWTLRSEERLAPAGTRSVRIELLCRKTMGDYCEAYFDELELVASYP